MRSTNRYFKHATGDEQRASAGAGEGASDRCASSGQAAPAGFVPGCDGPAAAWPTRVRALVCRGSEARERRLAGWRMGWTGASGAYTLGEARAARSRTSTCSRMRSKSAGWSTTAMTPTFAPQSGQVRSLRLERALSREVGGFSLLKVRLVSVTDVGPPETAHEGDVLSPGQVPLQGTASASC